jgi:hypothetical protein
MNTKMKVLSLAMFGLVGTAFAGSAAAVCPASPVPPWTAAPALQGTVVIADGGLAGTECRMDSTIDAGGSSAAFATVQDDSPATETQYRAQFIVDLDALAAPTVETSATIFSARSDGTGNGVALGIFGLGGQWFVSYLVTDGSSFASQSAPLSAGANHIEFDLHVGSPGSITLWVENNNEGSPTIPSVDVGNGDDAGIDSAFLGLAGPTPQFVAAYGGTAAKFDQFDSRRTTFIGF